MVKLENKKTLICKNFNELYSSKYIHIKVLLSYRRMCRTAYQSDDGLITCKLLPLTRYQFIIFCQKSQEIFRQFPYRNVLMTAAENDTTQ